jgi:cysteine-rich repeat protein
LAGGLFLTGGSAYAVECPDVTLNCTAQDVDFSIVSVLPNGSGDGTCSGPADTIEVVVTVEFASNNTRYDLAVWVPDDGIGVSCVGEEVNGTNSSGATDLDGGSDLCWDLDPANDPVEYSAVFTIPCYDADQDQLLDDFDITGSWYQPGGNALCTGASYAGTSAKCKATVTGMDIAVPIPADCGDGNLDSGEQCDDGDSDNTDDCLNNCQDASCGDGYVWVGNETCDDANTDNTDACLNTCEAASCGDGFVQFGVEECDDGPAGSATCSTSCEFREKDPRVPSVPSGKLLVMLFLLLTIGFVVVARSRFAHR